MKMLGVVGPDAAALLDRLAPALDGRVAAVESLERTTGSAGRPFAATFDLATDGTWSGAGEDGSLSDLLDSLAPAYDYALLSGFPDADVPTVALGDAEARDVRYRAPDVDAVVVEDVLDALADVEPHVTLETLVRRVKASPRAERAGAIATFTGRVRSKDAEGDPRTTKLEFEKYEGVAEARMEAIERELAARDGVQEVVMFHRTGLIGEGEDIVFVVVLAGHREEAFRAVEDGINRLKDEVPIFKKETTVDEEFWVHDRT
ncbi:MAG: molybdopterin synthase [Salinigranum sp.]